MARLGKNVKITAGRGRRGALSELFREALECEMASPVDDFDIYTFSDGAHVGIYFVADEEALTEAQLYCAPWLEFIVADPVAAKAALSNQGVTSFSYERDPEHDYFRAPGGQVFRLAQTTDENR